jgi:hypothetical protein
MDLPEPMRANWLDALDGQDAELRPWLARVLGRQGALLLERPGGWRPRATFSRARFFLTSRRSQ